MLKYMRTHAASWGIKVLLGLIIVVFIFWGVGRIESKRKTVVATVAGQYIAIGEFDKLYRDLLLRYERMLGKSLTLKEIQSLGIKNQALFTLIDSSILRQEAERWGIIVGDEEVGRAILKDPSFQREGRFSRDLYLFLLRRQGMEPGEYEERVKTALLVDRIRSILGDNLVHLSDEELRSIFSRREEKIRLEFVKVSPEKFMDEVKFEEKDLEDFYSAHREEFRVPEKVKVTLLRFRPSDFLDEVEVSDEEIQNYYEENRNQYFSPKKVKVRHILLPLPPDAKEEKVEEVRKKAEELLERVRKGEDFAKLAREYSKDPTAEKGGDLGYLLRQDIDPDFARVAFSLKKGEAGIARTRFGFHVLKVEDIKEERVIPLEEVRDKILSQLRREKATDRAALEAADSSYKAKKRGDLSKYAEEAGLKLITPPPFSRGKEVPEVGPRPKVVQEAFSLSPGEISSVIEDGGEYFVLQLLEKIPSRIAPFEEVKDRVARRYKELKAREMAREVALQVMEKWREGGLEEFLKERGLKVEETDYFPRSSSFIPKVGLFGKEAQKVQILTPQHPFLNEVVEGEGVLYVVHLKEVKPLSPKEYGDKNEDYRRFLEEMWRKQLLSSWLRERREQVKIELNEELLSRYQ